MKTKLTLVLFASFFFSIIAAQAQEVGEGAKKTTEQKSDSNEVFAEVTDPAQFPGGEVARVKYFMENIKYPKEAVKNKKQGTVYISFVIEADGSITNVRVLRGVCPSIDAEAVRLIKSMPKWEPAKAHDKVVRSQFNMPLRFVIPNPTDNDNSAKDSKKKKKEKKHHKKPKATDLKQSSEAVPETPQEVQ
jgi:TonB family protein